MKFTKSNILLLTTILILFSCGEIMENVKDNMIQSEQVFYGKKNDLIQKIQIQYKAEAANVGVSWRSFDGDESEWVSVLVHNAKEKLSYEDGLELAKFVYENMDTSMVKSNEIEVKQSTKSGFIISMSSSNNQFYPYYELDSNITMADEKLEKSIDTEYILDSLITKNENTCNTIFYKALLNSWKGNLDIANKEFLDFEACNVERYGLGRYGSATQFIVLLVADKDQEEIKAGVELLIPNIDSLNYENYTLFGN